MSHTPRRRRRRALTGLVGLAAVYTLAGFASARVRHLDAEPGGPRLEVATRYSHVLRGVTHVHTEASHDAEGSLDEVAAAARRAGLDFVVLSDHPQRPPRLTRPPAFRQGVLIVDGHEITIRQDGVDRGRLIIAGLDTAVVRWEGSLDELSRRVRSTGALAMVVHGRAPRENERWSLPPIDGVVGWEVMDLGDIARRRLNSVWAPFHIADLITGGLERWPSASILRLNREGFDDRGILAWDSLDSRSPIAATAGLNHHPKARILGFAFPGYGPFFRTAVNQVLLDSDTNDPYAGRDAITDALRHGAAFISLGEARAASGFRFTATSRDGTCAEMGDNAPLGNGTRLRAAVHGMTSHRIVFRVLHDGRTIAWRRGPSLDLPIDRPGAYRIEAYRYGLRLGRWYLGFRPWIFSNPIRLHRPADPTA